MRGPSLAVAATIGALVLLLTACSGQSASTTSSASSSSNSGNPADGKAGKDPSKFVAYFTTENSQNSTEITDLSKDQCSAENAALPLQIQNTPSAQMAQKLQLLAGQNALTSIYQASQSHVNPGGDFYKTGNVLDIGAALNKLGVADDITPAAQSVMKQIFDNTVPTLPLQFNVEGIFYNKKIFAQLGLSVPTSYDELMSDAAKIKAAGITPFTASGLTGYTISRWIGIYLYRELGPNALVDIQTGKAKLTDPDYVKAAQALQNMGKKGYFPQGVTNLDASGAQALLLTGKAAMMYNLSSFLAAVNDPSQDTVGADNIGFMPFPTVAGGKGTIDQWPANVGSPNEMNPRLYGSKEAAWVKCIAENYGSALLHDQGALSGFKVNTPVTNIPQTTADMQKTVSGVTQTVLWFEALMGQKATTDSQNDSAALLTGAMSAQQFMSVIQADQSAP